MSKRRTPSTKQPHSNDGSNNPLNEDKPRTRSDSKKNAMTERNGALVPPGQSRDTGKQAGALQLAICVCGIYASLYVLLNASEV